MARRCGRTRDLMPLMLVGEATPADEEFVRFHLQECAACRRETERLQTLLGSLAIVEVPDPGEAYWDGFHRRLRRRIEKKRSRGSIRWSLPWPALSAGTAMLLLAGVLGVGWWPQASSALRRTQEVAGRTRPEEIREAFEKVYPGTGAYLPIDSGLRSLPSANQMQEALDVVAPADESDIYATIQDLPPEARRWLKKLSFGGAV